MFKLVISDDEGQTTVVPLLRDQITIGRQEGNTIRLTERNVSRNHARLVKREDSYVVEDLGSYNGVTVNGLRVEAAAELSSGDQLGIGDYALALESDAVPVAPRPAAPTADSRPPPRLVVLSEPAAGAEFSLSKPIMRIGRDERLDIWINHKSISHEHVEIQLAGGVVTVFDLESANGVRVNGIDTKRAILESGDILELGAVSFRFVVPEGTHTLERLPTEAPEAPAPSFEQKSVFIVGLLVLLVLAGAGAILVTMPEERTESAVPVQVAPIAEIEQPEATPAPLAELAAEEATNTPEEPVSQPPAPEEIEPIDEPQEWEELLSRAQSKLARGQIDAAYEIASELPTDSVLRDTPEFGEIRYRYAQVHISAGDKALRDGDAELAKKQAQRVLGLKGITSKQRRDAKRLLSQASRPSPREQPSVSPEEALAEAHQCVASGDNACVIRALEGGRARSPAALALLIETYRAMDDLPAAHGHMRAFVDRYPDNPRTPRYRQMLTSE
ncbi:MAG: FHA domain-containing protein [Myxococcales bacterium]|nr:FHA domain-containing protein [Myxococcales bacterium]MDH3485828.1 FHA domain-containing protein [Myxococcales bacterium]